MCSVGKRSGKKNQQVQVPEQSKEETDSFP